MPDTEAGHGPKPGREINNAARICILVAVGALAVAWFFRVQIANGFTVTFGDRYDGVIEISILEHWYQVFRGHDVWNRTGYFYPYADTLGYNDGYFLYGVIYSVARHFGFDPFRAGELVNVTLKSLGFLAFFSAAKRIFALADWQCLAGAVLFTIATNTYVSAGHAQLLSLALAPLMALLIWECAIALHAGRRAMAVAAGCAAGVTYGAWLISTYYMPWFFGFFCLLMATSYAVRTGRGGIVPVLQLARRELVCLALITAMFLLCLLPFLLVYLPATQVVGMHHFADAYYFSPYPWNIVDLRSSVGLLDAILPGDAAHFAFATPPIDERNFGFAPVLLGIFVLGALTIRRGATQGRERLIAYMALAVIVNWVLLFHLRNTPPWQLVFNFVPGAKGLRAIGRDQIFFTFPICLIVAWMLGRIRTRHGWMVVGALCTILIAEEFCPIHLIAIDRTFETHFLATLPPVPVNCKIFYAATEQPPATQNSLVDAYYSGNVGAMLVASITGIPTINGISTFNPPDWNFVDPNNPNYPARITTYARRHHLQALCGLDFTTNTWTPPIPP